MAYQNIDQKKEEFKKYLEQGGVIDNLTKVLVELYEEAEKPHDAMEFIKSQMQVGGDDEVASLKRELETTRAENEALRKQVADLQARLQ